MTPAIESRDLGRRYRRTWALRGCTLALPEGRVIALVGPNGAGKSTLLNLAAGLLQPSEGTLRIFGEPLDDRPAALARISYMAQETALYPTFTVAELLTFGRRLNPGWDDRWARERLSRLRLPSDVPAGRLSGGQRAQVALVLALAKRPRLLLLDEPLASLDPVARHDVMALLMESVAEAGMTVVLSSHIISDLVDTCDWLVTINQGRVQVSGDIDELLATHRLLTGPREALDSLPPRLPVVAHTVNGRQASVLARIGAHRLAPVWTVNEVSLDELVLCYLRQPASSALPGPTSVR
ncbi:ABC transporter ATP-binding protein [Plantactinospora sp. S1510]|uniref:ABC transporter ATP-binding protein n=1 Tax=Plantactinospora alkalitolerans TaxID=2789879 RepID=A0ABS0GT36_9ACTN|nr:ABC transporter ATP-binding protein [Plantactinospora alkalitolerans]MBF9129057.1 ABC transporter ATP-binding protein [Plantactinospora alkalitolerans]